jgi:hypothetical protein
MYKMILTGSKSTIGILPLVPNPWLSYLNLKHQTMPVSYQNKIYLYAAVNMPATQGYGLDINDRTKDLLMFNVASNGVKNLGDFEHDSFGYWNDGPVPLTGQLMDMSKSFDEWVASSNNSTTIAPYNSWLFGKTGTFAKYSPGSLGYEGNGYAKHRLFMDYNHDRMLNGCYVEDTSDMNHMSAVCWKNPWDWITYATYASDKNRDSNFIKQLKNESKSALEPLFLAIQQDLNPPTDTNTKLDCIFNAFERFIPGELSTANAEASVDRPDGVFYRSYSNGNLIGSYQNTLYVSGKVVNAVTNQVVYTTNDPVPVGATDFWAGRIGCLP